jgi:hypothetical protein
MKNMGWGFLNDYLEQQGDPLGKWGLHRKQWDHISDLDKTVTQGKVAKTLDQFKFNGID